MSPNPSTVYADEFDPVEQAGGGPREVEDDGGDEELAVYDSGECISAGGLVVDAASGVGGTVPESSIDMEGENVENVPVAADIIDHLRKLESECQRLEAVWIGLKGDCKVAFAAFEASQANLRSYIRGITEPLPLFEGESDASPAGEDSVLDGAPPRFVGAADENEQRLGDKLDSDDPGGPPSQASAADPGSQADARWEAVDLAGILPPGIAAKLAFAGIRTVGEWQGRDRGKKISGMAAPSVRKVKEKIGHFFARCDKEHPPQVGAKAPTA